LPTNVPPSTPLLDKTCRQWHFAGVLEVKYQGLRTLLNSFESCIVAYSGGVDSAFLALMARQVLGDKSLAVIADSPSLPRRELQEALDLGRRFGFPVRVIATDEFKDEQYLSNPLNRCYFCKHELFSRLAPIARADGFRVIAYGENASDISDDRPGAKAASEFQVRAPLKEAGLNKDEIRQLSAKLGLPTASKAQMACLSSRVPHGERVSHVKLSMIEQAENCLRDIGFYDVRVRHHELPALPASASTTIAPRHLARIEVGIEEQSRLFQDGLAMKVVTALRQIGYTHVTLDLMGYTRGKTSNSAKLSVETSV
jgi:uncharacterized protein